MGGREDCWCRRHSLAPAATACLFCIYYYYVFIFIHDTVDSLLIPFPFWKSLKFFPSDVSLCVYINIYILYTVHVFTLIE